MALQIQHQQKQNPKKEEKNGPEEYKEILYCFYYALENPSKTCTTKRTYKLWRERSKTQGEYIDPNKLANVRRDVLHKKGIAEAEISEIKEEVREQLYGKLRITLKREKSTDKDPIEITMVMKKVLSRNYGMKRSKALSKEY